MKKITKENLEEFLNFYHGFHDSYITDINYDIKTSCIEMFIDVFWSGEPKILEDNTYETNKTNLKMIFSGIEKCNVKEIFSWGYISEAFIKYIKLDNKDFICFSDDEKEPKVYIVCDDVSYEEISKEDDRLIYVHDKINTVYEHANNLYEKLKDTCELGHFNKHLIKVNNSFIEQAYYMPVISMQDKGDICFNFDDVSYEFYFTRENLQKYLEVLIEKYPDKLSIYTSANCDVDLYFVGDKVNDINDKLNEYDKEEVMGITIDANDFSDKYIVDNFLELVNLFKEENHE